VIVSDGIRLNFLDVDARDLGLASAFSHITVTGRVIDAQPTLGCDPFFRLSRSRAYR